MSNPCLQTDKCLPILGGHTESIATLKEDVKAISAKLDVINDKSVDRNTIVDKKFTYVWYGFTILGVNSWIATVVLKTDIPAQIIAFITNIKI